jgi:Holliday junction DNA helicase RuvB
LLKPFSGTDSWLSRASAIPESTFKHRYFIRSGANVLQPGLLSIFTFPVQESPVRAADRPDPQQRDFENKIRPQSIAEFSGQPHLIENLRIFIKAANARGEALDHVLFHGPPGLGKTTLSRIVAAELGVNIKETSGPVIEKPADLAGLLTGLQPRDVLFIDEIHRLSTVVEEYLYSAMEDFKIDIMIDSGPAARSIQLSVAPFTLVGATTRSGLLTAPLLSRFGIKNRLDYYPMEVLQGIVARAAGVLGVKITSDAAGEVARRSRGTPRIANGLLRRMRDFAQVLGNGVIDMGICEHGLKALNVDASGLDEMDNRILSTLIEKFKGGPVGIGNIATAVGEETGTLEEVYEPFLIQEGYIVRTQRGREATEKAYQHLGKIPSGTGTLWKGQSDDLLR